MAYNNKRKIYSCYDEWEAITFPNLVRKRKEKEFKKEERNEPRKVSDEEFIERLKRIELTQLEK